MSDRVVTLSDGAGGDGMRRFIKRLFVERFGNATLGRLEDAALVSVEGANLAFTTDSYVIHPPEFPGGDIGKLCICGTVNDLVVMGARPLYISAGFILEEGLDLSLLERITASAAETARRASVEIVTGDTKVVPRGACDGIFINTAGLGLRPWGKGLSPKPIQPGDAIILSGTAGDHGIAVLGAREGLQFQTNIASDCAPLHDLVGSVLMESAGVRWMRDPTRGGVAAVLNELTESAPFGALIQEADLPVRDEVRAICELLGFDPLHLANEGKVLMVVDSEEANPILEMLRAHPLGSHAAMIGRITEDGAGYVRLKTGAGGIRRLQRPAGELLPRIC